MTVGVLALQGDFREHAVMLHRIGAEVCEVRLPRHLAQVERLIIPGGESTTIGKLLAIYRLIEPIRERVAQGMPLWGTCAGAILLSRRITDGRDEQPTLGLMDLTARRNAFGSQLDSFEADLMIDAIGEAPHHAVFIRAPILEQPGPKVQVLARLADGAIVAAQQAHLLATCFHPELTRDERVHRYFLEL
ncbi:MAG TPA: pyridoxal 5'-phosphate synthase glutaminase subunit PdxT [Roseiflexaceae bacterium]|nr:pyridoxal 5'-phosphate synthase glutaminase subunit PdxT [Roseiflexaceae bacterium]HMP38922.1 pyridoxal 5'-phosphate synthase glutaminase subunit PdxT [Roseiflexaceae bacterium]